MMNGQGVDGRAGQGPAQALGAMCERVRDHETALLLLVDRQLRNADLDARTRAQLRGLRRKLRRLAGALEHNLSRLEATGP